VLTRAYFLPFPSFCQSFFVAKKITHRRQYAAAASSSEAIFIRTPSAYLLHVSSSRPPAAPAAKPNNQPTQNSTLKTQNLPRTTSWLKNSVNPR